MLCYVIVVISGHLLAPNMRGYPHSIFSFLKKNLYCGYSLEAPCRGASNEYHNNFLVEKKKNVSTFRSKKKLF